MSQSSDPQSSSPSVHDEAVSEQKAAVQNEPADKPITFFSFMLSIVAAWFGVQSKANRERDFQHGKFHHFVIGGIVFAVLFVLAVVGLVKLVLHFAMPGA